MEQFFFAGSGAVRRPAAKEGAEGSASGGGPGDSE